MKLVSMFCTKTIYLSESILSHNYQKIVNSELFAEKPILTEEVKSDETFKGSSVVYGEKTSVFGLLIATGPSPDDTDTV